MAYIGISPVVGEFKKLDDISSQFNDSNTTFNLTVAGSAVTAGSAQNLIISIDGVIQEPQASYTVGGTTISFTEAPNTASAFFGILLGSVAQVGTVSDGAITTSKIADGAITADKIADGTVIAADIADNAVTTAKIIDNAITTSKIADANVTIAKLNINADLNFAAANIFNAGLKAENIISTSNVTTLNYANATVFTCTATEQSNITLSNFPQEGIALLKLRNGGAFTIAYAGNAYFATGTAPILTSSGLDHLYFQGNALGYLVTSVLDIQED